MPGADPDQACGSSAAESNGGSRAACGKIKLEPRLTQRPQAGYSPRERTTPQSHPSRARSTSTGCFLRRLLTRGRCACCEVTCQQVLLLTNPMVTFLGGGHPCIAHCTPTWGSPLPAPPPGGPVGSPATELVPSGTQHSGTFSPVTGRHAP